MNKVKFKIYLVQLLLIISGYISFFRDFMHIDVNLSFVSLGLDIILIVLAGFSFYSIQNAKKSILIIIFFVFCSLLSLFLNIDELDFIYFINGVRDFLPYFLFPIIFMSIFQSGNSIVFRKNMNAFLYIFLIFQIPISLLQYLTAGAGDNVGGTLGLGYSGVLTFTIFLSTYYLMIQKFDPEYFMKSIARKSYLLLFWIPTFINETKIAFLLIILFFLLLAPFHFKYIVNLFLLIIFLIPATVFFSDLYSKATGESFSNDIFNKEYITEYLSGDVDSYEDVPRFTKIIIAFEIQKNERLILGNGLGQFKGGTVLPLTSFATTFHWLLVGSVPMIFFIFIQLGLSGIVLFIMFWYYLFKNSVSNKSFKYSVNLSLFCTFSLIIIMMYNDSFRNLFFCGIIMYLLIFASYWKDEEKTTIS